MPLSQSLAPKCLLLWREESTRTWTWKSAEPCSQSCKLDARPQHHRDPGALSSPPSPQTGGPASPESSGSLGSYISAILPFLFLFPALLWTMVFITSRISLCSPSSDLFFLNSQRMRNTIGITLPSRKIWGDMKRLTQLKERSLRVGQRLGRQLCSQKALVQPLSNSGTFSLMVPEPQFPHLWNGTISQPKGNWPRIFLGRADAEAEAPVLWTPDAKNWLTGKDPDAVKDWGQENGVTEEEMVGGHLWLSGHEVEQSLGDSEGQGSLEHYSSWSHKELDRT